MSNTIVEKFENEFVVSHRVIAEMTENSEKTVSRLIRNHIDKLERFGRVGFQIHTLETAG